MKKPKMLLVTGGFLVVIGIGLSIYGSQLIVENLDTEENRVGLGKSIEISKNFDPSVNENGVYLLQVLDFADGTRLHVTVYDPFESSIVSQTIENGIFQGNFTIDTAGNYRMLVENVGERDFEAMIAIGYLPQDQSLTISFLGFIIIILGLVGLGVGAYSFFKSRNKINSN